jgi:hypothetical protein
LLVSKGASRKPNRGEFIEHEDVLNRIEPAVSFVRLLRRTLEGSDQLEAVEILSIWHGAQDWR